MADRRSWILDSMYPNLQLYTLHVMAMACRVPGKWIIGRVRKMYDPDIPLAELYALPFEDEENSGKPVINVMYNFKGNRGFCHTDTQTSPPSTLSP